MNKTIMIALLLLGAQVNLSALVPAAPGQAPPPLWVGGGFLWPFFSDTRTLLPAGALRDALTPILGAVAATLFLMAGAALLGWLVPASWIPWLVAAAAVCSVTLHVVWFSGWALLPLIVDAALLWSVFGSHATDLGLRL